MLAWVVYSSPFSTKVAGCGDWGIDGFYAKSGTAMADYGWSTTP